MRWSNSTWMDTKHENLSMFLRLSNINDSVCKRLTLTCTLKFGPVMTTLFGLLKFLLRTRTLELFSLLFWAPSWSFIFFLNWNRNNENFLDYQIETFQTCSHFHPCICWGELDGKIIYMTDLFLLMQTILKNIANFWSS